MILHVNHAMHMFIKYKNNQGLLLCHYLEPIAKATYGPMWGKFVLFQYKGTLPIANVI